MDAAHLWFLTTGFLTITSNEGVSNESVLRAHGITRKYDGKPPATVAGSGWALLLCRAAAGDRTHDDPAHKVKIRDVASVEGIRDNSLIGYGLVVGLKGTGDKQQTYFTIQTLASILQRMGVQIPSSVIQTTVQVKNVAAVFVTASLPPFSRPGVPLDVTVSSAGDARSLEGGLLLLTPLYAADGQVYASAQGPLVLGGYLAGSATNSKVLNHPTVGRIPGGALVERGSALDLARLDHVSLLLNDASFSTAEDMAAVINHEWLQPVATVIDSRRVDVEVALAKPAAVPALLARIENLEIEVRRRAKVVVNERTGTVVLGKDVHLGAVSILHGNFSVEVTTAYAVVPATVPAIVPSGGTAGAPLPRPALLQLWSRRR